MFHFHIDKTMVIPLGENANTDGAVLVHHDSLLLGKEHQPQNCKAVQAQYHAEFDKLKKLIGEKLPCSTYQFYCLRYHKSPN